MSCHLPHFSYKFTVPLTNNTVFMSKYISRHKSVVTVAFWVFLQSLNIIAAHAIDHSVFAGVPPSMK